MFRPKLEVAASGEFLASVKDNEAWEEALIAKMGRVLQLRNLLDIYRNDRH